MELVVDANIVLSALLAGNLSDIILSPHLKLVAPALLARELDRNTEAVKERTALSEPEFNFLLESIKRKVRFVPDEEFVREIGAARALLEGYDKDAPYVALARARGCRLWSYEKRFAKTHATLTTADVRAYLHAYRA